MNEPWYPKEFPEVEILRMASELQPTPKDGHVADDDELLACWSAGLLAPAEVRKLIDHMAICPQCRRDVAEMIKAGVIEYQEPHRWRGTYFLPLALAASLLVVIGGLFWGLMPSSSEIVLAQAEQKLAAGDALGAMDDVERLAFEASRPAIRAKAQVLLQRAGEDAAGRELLQKRWGMVATIVHRVDAGAGLSARLLNLKLQAEQGIPSEVALAVRGDLTYFGYSLDGSSVYKDLPLDDEATRRIDVEFQDAVGEFPNDTALFLNRGYFLLTRDKYEEAARCFAAVVSKDPEHGMARLGLGLAKFGQNDYRAALAEFEAVLTRQPDHRDAHLNAAACLSQLGKRADALKHRQRVLELTNDGKLQK
jgi:tetratricopeptide (TPR) repeat protein